MRFEAMETGFESAREMLWFVRRNPKPYNVKIFAISGGGPPRLVAIQRPNGTIDFRDLPFMASTITFQEPEQ